MSLVHSQQAQARGQAGAQQVQTSQDGDLFPTVRVGSFGIVGYLLPAPQLQENHH